MGGLPAAEARLDCGGRPHRLRWAAGQLTTPDHTGDLEGEQILSALGGQGFPCLDVLESWARHAADPRVLTLTSRGPADPLVTQTPPPLGWSGPTARRGRPGWAGPPRGRARSFAMLSHGQPDDPDDDLIRLIGLGSLLPDRLAATVIATWAERLRGPAVERPGRRWPGSTTHQRARHQCGRCWCGQCWCGQCWCGQCWCGQCGCSGG